MASENAISARITADASGFRSGAQEAAGHIDSLSGRLKEFRTHVRTEARYTKFLGTQIENLGIVSEGAAGAIGHLISGFAFGGGLGVAVASVKVLVEAFHAVTEAIDESNEHFKKLQEDAKANAEAFAQHVEDVLSAMEGQTQAEIDARKSLLPLLSKETQLNKELGEVRERLAKINENVDENGLVADVAGLNRETKKQIELEAQLAAVRSELGSKRGGVGKIAGAEGGKADEAAEEARRKIQLAQSIADAQSAAEHATAENEINLKALLANQEIAQLKLTADEKLALIAEVAAAQARADEASEESGRNLLTIQVAQEQEARAEADALAEDAKRSKELGRAVMQMGTAAGEAFLGMLDGSKSVEESLLQLIAEMVKAALQMAALREIASGDFIGGGLLAAGAAIAGGIGSLTGGSGGGGNTSLTVNNTFHGTQNASEVSLAMERSAMNVIRRMQSRGRFT